MVIFGSLPLKLCGINYLKDLWLGTIIFGTYCCNFLATNKGVYMVRKFFMLCDADASKNGVAQETLQYTIRRGSKVMTEQEARQILGVTEETAWEEVLKVNIALYPSLYLFILLNVFWIYIFLHLLNMCRNMTLYLRGILRAGAFTFNQRFIGRRNV